MKKVIFFQFLFLGLIVCTLVLRLKGGLPEWINDADPRLSETEATLFLEVFWDLVIEKKLTIGLNHANPQYPFFRVHSEANL